MTHMHNNSKPVNKNSSRHSVRDLRSGIVPYTQLEVRRVLAGDVLYHNLATNSSADLIAPVAAGCIANADQSGSVPNCQGSHSQLDPKADGDIPNDGNCEEQTNLPPPFVTPNSSDSVDELSTVGTEEPTGGFIVNYDWNFGSEVMAQPDRIGFNWDALFVGALPVSGLLKTVMASQAVSQSPIVKEIVKVGEMLSESGLHDVTYTQRSQFANRPGTSFTSKTIPSLNLDNLQVLSLKSGAGLDTGSAPKKMAIETPSHNYFCSSIDSQGASRSKESTIINRVANSGLIDHHQAFALVSVPAQEENQIQPAFDNNATDGVKDGCNATMGIYSGQTDASVRYLEFALASWDSTVDFPKQLEFTQVQNIQFAERSMVRNDERRPSSIQSVENDWRLLSATAAVASFLGTRPGKNRANERLGQVIEVPSNGHWLVVSTGRLTGIRRFSAYCQIAFKRLIFAKKG